MSNDVISRVCADQPPAVVEAIVTAVDAVLVDLHAFMHPEEHPGYDPEHVFWADKTEEEILTYADRHAAAAALWAPVAARYRSGDIAGGDRAAAAVSGQLEALGDLEAFQWDSGTACDLIERIEWLRGSCAQIRDGAGR